MVFVWLTQDEADQLSTTAIDPGLRSKIRAAMREELIPYNEAPKTVIWRDAGDGLNFVAVAYHDDKYATEAFDDLWARLQHEENSDARPARHWLDAYS